jgi:hypothetical protein
VTNVSIGINSDGSLINSTGTPIETAYDKSANIRGKPAESVLGWWISKFIN